MNCLIVGHSYIRRLRSYLRGSQHYPQGLFPQSQHVLHFIHEGGATLMGPRSEFIASMLTPTNAGSPDMAYISLGINDLIRGQSPASVAHHLIAMACHIHSTLGATWVIIDQILPCCQSQYPSIKSMAVATNKEIEESLASGEYPFIKLWKHHGFWNGQPLWDGIHLNEVGIQKHWRSIKNSILWVEHRLQN